MYHTNQQTHILTKKNHRSRRFANESFLAIVQGTPGLFIFQRQSSFQRFLHEIRQSSKDVFHPDEPFQILDGPLDESRDEDEVDVGIVARAKVTRETPHDIDESVGGVGRGNNDDDAAISTGSLECHVTQDLHRDSNETSDGGRGGNDFIVVVLIIVVVVFQPTGATGSAMATRSAEQRFQVGDEMLRQRIVGRRI